MRKSLIAVLLVSAAAYAAPALANGFSDPITGINLNVGSAPNPKPGYAGVPILERVQKAEDENSAGAQPAPVAQTQPSASPSPVAERQVPATAPQPVALNDR